MFFYSTQRHKATKKSEGALTLKNNFVTLCLCVSLNKNPKNPDETMHFVDFRQINDEF